MDRSYKMPSNFLVGLCLWWLTILLTGFGAALMGSHSGEIAIALATVLGAIITGCFVLAAAWLAWKSVQAGIDAQENADRKKFKLAVTAELLTFSTSIIKAASDWNARAHQNAAAIPASPAGWPVLTRPHVYETLVSLIGLIEGWAASAVIGFYGNVLDLNELSKEAMQGRPTVGTNAGTIAGRFQTMAVYLADSLDGLNSDRAFPIIGHDLTALVTPNAATVAATGQAPTSLQELLRVLGGQPARRAPQAAAEP
jgi:hypothetical protein